jgi:hypothetical protein
MPSFDQRIGSAVGNQPALNSTTDQIVILNLLASVSPENGGPTSPLPGPIAGGQADFRLVNAIFNFQRQMVSMGLMPKSKNDGRVDPNGTTLGLMNKFAGFKGGGAVQPENPAPLPLPSLPTPTPKKGRGFLQSLFAKMTPRPTNWKIAGTGSISLSAAEFGFVKGFISVSDSRKPNQIISLNMIGGGLSLGPLPFGVEIAPGDFPSIASQIHAGPRTQKTILELEDLTGLCVMVGASASAGPGSAFRGANSTAFLFNVGSNRSLKTLAVDILNSVGPNSPINFLNDAINTSKAFASTAGIFAGASIGVSLMEAKLFRDNIF